MKDGIYFALLTPEDRGRPEMFFSTEKWARAALNAAVEENPLLASKMTLVRVQVKFEVVS